MNRSRYQRKIKVNKAIKFVERMNKRKQKYERKITD